MAMGSHLVAHTVHIEVAHLDASSGEWVVADLRGAAGQHIHKRGLADVWSPYQCNLRVTARCDTSLP